MLRRIFSGILWAGLGLVFYYVSTYLFSSTPAWIFWVVGLGMAGMLLGSPKKAVAASSNLSSTLMHTVRYSPATCRACNGRGRNGLLGSRCTRCRGRGSLLVAEPKRRCATCKGSGRRTLGRCPVCDGSGWSFWRKE